MTPRYERTAKSVVAIGERVVAKSLAVDGEYARARFAHEATVHRRFIAYPPPVRAPKLILTDGLRLLVVERLPGEPLNSERFPGNLSESTRLDALLRTLEKLHEWQPPRSEFPVVFNYPDRFRRYRGYGLLTDDEEAALTSAFGPLAGAWEFNHGDPVPSNVLVEDDDALLIDWEYAGWFLPGFDLAMLFTMLTNTPYALRRIEQAVARHRIEVPFAINLAVVLTRELRRHRELPAGRRRDQGLALLEPLWKRARSRLADVLGPHLLTTGI